MRKVLNWGVVPLNLKWQGMVVHGLCWARINSPENIRRFNSREHFIDPQTQATSFVILMGKWAIFSTFSITFLGPLVDRNNNTYLFVRPGPCLIEWYGCCCFDLLSLTV